jgi:tetratricopeptide (TPR) repeat protein
MFNRPYRLARAAEGAGDYRKAAALYVEAELPEDAANALLFHAARAGSLEERLAAYHDALRWLPEAHPRRPEVEGQIGLAILDDAQRRGARTAEEKRRLADAAERLERTGRPGDAANAWEMLERWDDVARCLEAAGDVERLERHLERTGAAEQRARRVARLVRDYEMAMAVGARLDARRVLREAVELAPEDTGIADLLRRLEGRMLDPLRVELVIDGQRVVVVGKLPVVLGRVGADVVVRGASVSRLHASLDVTEGGELSVADEDSRNGTLLSGVPIAREVRVTGEAVVGLGDDVTIRARPVPPRAVSLEVESGLDRGLVALAGEGALRLPAADAVLAFEGGVATLAAIGGSELFLGVQRCVLPVVLLEGDELSVGAHRIEVRR